MKYFMDYVKASYEVVMIGECRTGINLDHEIEAYLVHTYARYMENPNIPTDAIAIQFMNSLSCNKEIKKKLLEKIAEECFRDLDTNHDGKVTKGKNIIKLKIEIRIRKNLDFIPNVCVNCDFKFLHRVIIDN